jgi:phage terminase large subunit-like protein
MVELDAAGNIKPSKRKSKERIDGIVAFTMAIGRAIVQEKPRQVRIGVRRLFDED